MNDSIVCWFSFNALTSLFSQGGLIKLNLVVDCNFEDTSHIRKDEHKHVRRQDVNTLNEIGSATETRNFIVITRINDRSL